MSLPLAGTAQAQTPGEVTLLDTTMTVGWGSDGTIRPDNTGVGWAFGSLDDAWFDYSGVSYAITRLTVSKGGAIGGDPKVMIRTQPSLNLHNFNPLTVTIDGKPLDRYWRYLHGHSTDFLFHEVPAGLSLTPGDRVSVKVTVLPLRAPEKLTVTAIAPGLRISWDHPNDDRISWYEYRQKAGGGWSRWRIISGSNENTTSFTEKGLTPGGNYAFQVRAYQSVREGEHYNRIQLLRRAGPPSAIVSATAGTAVPDSIGGLTLPNDITRHGHSITFSWDKPWEPAYAPIQRYKARYLQTFSDTWCEQTVAATEVSGKMQGKLTGLAEATGYTVRMFAENKHGRSYDGEQRVYWSGHISDGTQADPRCGDAGGVIGKMSVNAEGGNGQVRVGWQTPDGGAGGQGGAGGLSAQGAKGMSAQGATVQSTAAGGQQGASASNTPADSDLTYEVAWTQVGWLWVDGGSRQVSSTEATVTGLENGEPYAFRVRARQDGDTALWSDWSDTAHATPTAAQVPEAPTAASATAGDGRLTVNWTAPEQTGASDITGYELDAVVKGTEWNAEPLVSSLDGSAATVTITGLANDTEYAVRVRAVSDAGKGAWSETVHATPTAPVAPGLSLILPFADLAVANGAARSLDMSEHFSGTDLTYEVLVTTTHKRTGEVKTAPINTVARNKVTGAWSDDVLTLTAGPSGHHVLTLAVTATDDDGETASDSFTLTVDATGQPGRPEAPTAVAGDGEIAVSWAAPSENGGLAVTSYDLDIGIGGDWSAGPDTVTGLTGTSRTVTGLANGTAYGFRIRAVNSAGAGEWSESVASTPKEANEVVAPSEPTGLAGTSGDGEVALVWTAPADDGGAAIASYEVDIGIGGDWSAGPDTLTGITGTSRTVTGLANGTVHDFRVRAVNSAGAGAWSETVSATPVAPATLILEFPDLELANGEVHTIDFAEHFSGTGLDYEVMVTTTHKRTGQVKTGPINTVARNKVRGSWSGHVLTLTAGPSGHHVLGMEVIATDLAGGTASDDFQLTVGTSETESLATEALRNALASQARSMLEDASSAIGGRMQSGGAGTDALTAFAGLFGGGRSVGGCPLGESLQECMTRDADHRDAPRFGGTHGFGPLSFDWNREDEGGGSVGLSEFRDRVNAQGFAVSLNQPLAFASSADGQTGAPAPGGPAPEAGMALTFWGRGAASSGVTDTMFWGLDASMGERWMAGLAFAESGAEVAQSLSRGDASVSGLATSEISAVYPYLRSHFGSGLEVWSLMGWGSGRVDSRWTGASLAPASEETVHLDGEVAFDLGLVGAEQTLFERKGFSLLALGDTGWSRLAVTSGLGIGVEATVSRTRLGLEGRYVSDDGALSSGLRAGARVDGGDGATASGMELLGDARRTWGRWQAGVEGRWYAADTADAGHGSQGVKATLGLQPRTNGTGLGLTISPGWGTQSEALKQDGLLAAFEEGASGQGSALAAHLDGRLSWGMRLPGQGLYGPGELLSPYAEFSFVEDGTHHLRTGVALEGPVGMGLALERRESPTGPAEHGVMVRLDTRF